MNKCHLSKYQMKTKPLEQILNRSQTYPKIRANKDMNYKVNKYDKGWPRSRNPPKHISLMLGSTWSLEIAAD